MKLRTLLIGFFVFLFVAPTVLFAQDKPSPKPTPTPQVSIVTGGSLFRAGDSVVIDEPVDGDVYCAGQNVTIKSVVSGDVICASQNMSIEGEVLGNVRVVGQHITMSAPVGRNVTVLGQSIVLTQEGAIAGELLGAGQTFLVNGIVGGWMRVAGQSVSLNGQVDGDVSVSAESFDVGSEAAIGGALTYQATKQITPPKTARISGPVKFTPVEENQKAPRKRAMVSWPGSAVGGILVYLAIGLLVVIFAKKLFPSVTGAMRTKPLATLLLGVAGVVGIPFVLLILTITIIGIPVAVLGGMLYIIIVLVATLFTTIVVGQWILEALAPKLKGNLVYQVLIGVPVTLLTLKMPFLGMILRPFALFWGVGGIMSALLAKRKKE